MLKFGHNMSAYEGLMHIEFGGTRSRDRNFTGQKWAKVGEFEPISITTDIDEKWFVIFEHTIYHLSLVMFIRANLHTVLFFVFSNFFFLFLPKLSTCKPLNAQYSNFERLKISGRTSVRLKSGVPRWGILLKRALQNLERLQLDGSNFRVGRY